MSEYSPKPRNRLRRGNSGRKKAGDRWVARALRGPLLAVLESLGLGWSGLGHRSPHRPARRSRGARCR
jgi:hypothetical protein